MLPCVKTWTSGLSGLQDCDQTALTRWANVPEIQAISCSFRLRACYYETIGRYSIESNCGDKASVKEHL
jgi:hypothetical protein